MNQDRIAEDPRTTQTGTERAEFHVLEPDGLASFASESTSVERRTVAVDAGELLLQFPEEGSRRQAHAIPIRRPASSAAVRPMVAIGVACLIVAAAAGGWWAARQRVTFVRGSAAPAQQPVAAAQQAERQSVPQPAPDLTLQPAREIAPIEPAAPAPAGQPEALAAVSSSRPENTPVVAAATPSSAAPQRPEPESARSRERLSTTQLGTSGVTMAEANAPARSRPTLDAAAEARPPASTVTPAPSRVDQPVMPRAPEATLAAAVLPPAAPNAQPQPLPLPPPAVPPAPAPSQPQAFATAAVSTEQGEIQQTLGQYRTAYQRLDAQAARTVWPSVDVRALGRAFSTLSSQQLAFDSCVFDIAGNSATAHCTGSATYTPKVGGGGSRSELRQWTFQLRKASEGWKIQNAQIRRDD